VAVLLSAGDQLPVMPLTEVVGNAGIVAFLQYVSGVTENVGVTLLFIVMVNVAVVAHSLDAGVNV
jgi:hypothetical protein